MLIRIVAISLILINLFVWFRFSGYHYWEIIQTRVFNQSVVEQPGDVGGILLVGQTLESPSVKQEETEDQGALVKISLQSVASLLDARDWLKMCLRVGPSPDNQLVQEKVIQLPVGVQLYRYHSAQPGAGIRGVMYRVYAPSEKTLDGALGLQKDIEARGVEDTFVITSGKLANTVSLGVYREVDKARARIADLAKKGVEATMAPIGSDYTGPRQYWVNVGYADDQAWESAMKLSTERIAIKQITCDLLK